MGRREEKKIENVREVAEAAVAALRAAEAALAAAVEERSAAQTAKDRGGGLDKDLRLVVAKIAHDEREDEKRAAALSATDALDAVDEAEGAAWRRSAIVASLGASVATEKRLRAELDATLVARRDLYAAAAAALASAAAARAAKSLPVPLHEPIVRNYAATESAEKVLARLTDESEGRGRFAPHHRQQIQNLRFEEIELRATLERALRADEERRRREAIDDETRREVHARRTRASADEHRALEAAAQAERAETEKLAEAHRKRTAGTPSTGAAP